MMKKIYSIGVAEALEKLAYPSFFERTERKAAFDLVMLWGDDEERLEAEKVRGRHPFDVPEETLFPALYENAFSIASVLRHT